MSSQTHVDGHDCHLHRKYSHYLYHHFTCTATRCTEESISSFQSAFDVQADLELPDDCNTTDENGQFVNSCASAPSKELKTTSTRSSASSEEDTSLRTWLIASRTPIHSYKITNADTIRVLTGLSRSILLAGLKGVTD